MARSRKPPTPAPSPATLATETLYLVRRLYEDEWDSIFCNSAAFECAERSEWGGPVKAFTGRGQAEALCRALDEKLLERRNPFRVQGGTLADLTSLRPGPFRDWLLDAGLTPPPPGKDRLADWGRWWEKNRPGMSAEQRHRVSARLDKLHFHGVTELEPPAKAPAPASGFPPAEQATGQRAAKGTPVVTVFTVVLLKWKDDDDFLADQDNAWFVSVQPCFSPDGGLRLATFRDHGQAASYRDELQRQVPEHSRAFYRNGFGVSEHAIEVEG